MGDLCWAGHKLYFRMFSVYENIFTTKKRRITVVAKSHWRRGTTDPMNNTLCTISLCFSPNIKRDTFSFRRCCRKSKRCPKSSFIWPDSAELADCSVTHDQFVTRTVNHNLISSFLGTLHLPPSTFHPTFNGLKFEQKNHLYRLKNGKWNNHVQVLFPCYPGC